MARKPLIGEVDVQELVDRLAFTQEETQDAALEQAKLYMAAATYRIKKMRTRQEAEQHADNLRVDYSLKMRLKFKGQKGMTEKAISEMVDRVPEVRAAITELATAKRLEEWSKLLLDAYEHRRSSIKVITQFAFMQDSMNTQFETDKMKNTKERLKREMGKDQEE